MPFQPYMGLHWSENTLVGPQTSENEIALGKSKLTMGTAPGDSKKSPRFFSHLFGFFAVLRMKNCPHTVQSDTTRCGDSRVGQRD